jgi:nucleotide-binding universal stress UspA family protein
MVEYSATLAIRRYMHYDMNQEPRLARRLTEGPCRAARTGCARNSRSAIQRAKNQRQEATATPSIVLAMLDHPAAANGLLAAAGCLADLSGGGHINVLVARVPPASTILASEEVLTRDKEAQLRAREDARVASLKTIFDAWKATAKRPEGSVKWLDLEAVARGLITEWGKRADFIVLEQPGRHEYGTTWQALPAAVFETDRPVLLVPPGLTTSFGQSVAIAWRDDPHATRAVLSALRCATRAASVHLLAGVRPRSPKPRVPEILAEHGVEAGLRIIAIGGEPFGSALLAQAHALGADMLVMGAFAHGQLRELILGGVTRYMIAHADLPVLMRH